MVAAALADGDSKILLPLDAEDTRATAAGLEALGILVSRAEGCWTIRGRGGHISGGGNLDLRESGTTLRFLTAVAALGVSASRLDGTARLRQRPLDELSATLRSLGAHLDGDRLPLDVGGAPFKGGTVNVDGSRSSQFASALMLIGPCLAGGLRIHLDPPAVSLPYIELTRHVMREFGIETTEPEPRTWQIPEGRYRASSFSVDGDHSSASYFLAAPLVAGGRVRVEGVNPRSAQADAAFPEILERLGASVRRGEDWIEVHSQASLAPFDLSMAHAPDLVPTLAVLGLFTQGPSMIRDVGHLKLKESDRLEQLALNLRRLGGAVESGPNWLSIGPLGTPTTPARIETAGDHRIAMAFALVGLSVAGLTLDDADCVAKSNPRFWTDWEAMLAG
jgi:3-phosphoshikimate 1-carboxyvinyltransferase